MNEIKIIGPQQGVAQEPQIGDMGYFWDYCTGPVCYGELTTMRENDFPYQRNLGGAFSNFSPALPEWFPVIRKQDVEKPKPIELPTSHGLDTISEIRLVELDYRPKEYFKDLIFVEFLDGQKYVFQANWNSGTL